LLFENNIRVISSKKLLLRKWHARERRELLNVLVAKTEGRRSLRRLKTLKGLLKKQSL